MFPMNEMQYSYFSLMLLSQLCTNRGNPNQDSREIPELGGQDIKATAPPPAFQQTDSKISDDRP